MGGTRKVGKVAVNQVTDSAVGLQTSCSQVQMM